MVKDQTTFQIFFSFILEGHRWLCIQDLLDPPNRNHGTRNGIAQKANHDNSKHDLIQVRNERNNRANQAWIHLYHARQEPHGQIDSPVADDHHHWLNDRKGVSNKEILL